MKIKPQQISLEVLAEKYCKGDEKTADDIFKRVAAGVAQAESTPELQEKWTAAFYQMMKDGALGGGRIMSAAGSDVQATLINCFAAETYVPTKNGSFPIKQLKGKTVEVMTKFGWKPAKFRCFGRQQLYEVTLENGQTLHTTAGHRWFTINEERVYGTKRTQVLNEVTTLQLDGALVPVVPLQVRPDKNSDYYDGVRHGIIFGDGSQKCDYQEEPDYYVPLFGDKQSLFHYFEHTARSIRQDTRETGPCIMVYGYSANGANLKRLPVKKSQSYWYGFISGLLATDGHASMNVMLFNKDINILHKIAKHATKLGMAVSSVSLMREKSPYDGSYKPMYMLRFFKNSMCAEDFIRPVQQQAWSYKKTRRTSIRVVSVQPTDRFEKVYCAVEPETHSFVIEGNILTGNCFVQPIGDSITGEDRNGKPSIYTALNQAAETMRRGGGVGYDFSAIRPKYAKVKSTQSNASGPCSYIDVYDRSGIAVESAGARRGAQMGVLRVDHPDIVDFIRAKQTKGVWTFFNVSVNTSDEFMRAVQSDAGWNLVHVQEPSDKYKQEHGSFFNQDKQVWVWKTVKAREIWDEIMRSTYDYAEPGVLFLDQSNKQNNLWYCENFEATNPCGEQVLPDYGCCDLGQLFLTRFIKSPFTENATFDWAKFIKTAKTLVRFLDNVLDVTLWPLEEQRKEAMNKRRIGVGFTALGNAMAMLRIKYNSPEGIEFAANVSRNLRDATYTASVELAKEKGAFPLFDAEKFGASEFIKHLPDNLQKDIAQHGTRNSHLLSLAPVGTLSLAFGDNCSNGIEPSFTWSYNRNVKQGDDTWLKYEVEDYAFRLYKELVDPKATPDTLPEYFVSAQQLSVDDHLAVLNAVQPFIDASISKTINCPEDYPYEDFVNVYTKAWRMGLKGVTTYRPSGVRGAVLEVKDEKPKTSAAVEEAADPMTAPIQRRPAGLLHSVTQKIEYHTVEGKQVIYLIVSFIPVTLPDGTVAQRAIEFFMPVGQTVDSQQWVTATMRSLSLAARGGFLMRSLADLRKVRWDKGSIAYGTIRKPDDTQVPLWHHSEIALLAYAIQEIIKNYQVVSQSLTAPKSSSASMQLIKGSECQTCGAFAVIKVDGCSKCTACGEIGSCG